MKKQFALFALLLISLGLHAEEHKLSHKGITISAQLETASDAWQQGPVVLITHGTLAHNRMEIIATQQAMLAERGISSLAVNLSLGLSERSGMYDCAVPHTHKHTDALDEIGLWLEWLKKQGVSEVVLMGHSRGGNQTAWFAAERDDAVIKRIILVAPAVWSEQKEVNGYQERYNKPLAPVLARATQLVAAGKGDTMMKPVDFIYCADTSASADAFVNYYTPDVRMDTPTLLKQINKPVLVVIGSEDQVVKGLEEKMAKLDKKNVSYEVINGADHFFLDLYAEEIADLAEGFIGGE